MADDQFKKSVEVTAFLLESELVNSSDSKVYYWTEIRIAIFACFCTFLTGILLAWTAPTLPKLLAPGSEIKITSADGALIGFIGNIGGVAGAFLTSYLNDKYGRKLSMLLIVIPYFFATLTLYFAKSMIEICIFRILAGIVVGSYFNSVSLYISEMASAKIRGSLTFMKIFALNLGMLVENTAVPYLSIKTNALCLLSLTIFLILFISFIPESPYYFVLKKDYVNLEKTLKMLRHKSNVQIEMRRMIQGNENSFQSDGKILDFIMKRSCRKATFLVVILIFIEHFCCNGALVIYSIVVLQKARINISLGLCGMILSFTGLLSSIFSSWGIERFGRRCLLMWSCLVAIIPLAFIAIFFQLELYNFEGGNLTILVLISLVIIRFGEDTGLQPIPHLYVGELFPNKLRAKAYCFRMIIMCIFSALAIKQYQVTTDIFGEHITFYLFIIVSIFGGIYIYLYAPETRGKTLEDIQTELNK